MQRLFTLLFLTLFCTCGRAQITGTPTPLLFLADQLPEMGLAYGYADGDLGPTRLAFTRSQLEWQPSALGSSWTGHESNLPWLGAFTPHERNHPEKYMMHDRRHLLLAGGGPNHLAGRVHYRPEAQAWSGLELRYVDRKNDVDADNNERTDAPNRNSLFAATGADFNLNDIDWLRTGIHGQFLREKTQRGHVPSGEDAGLENDLSRGEVHHYVWFEPDYKVRFGSLVKYRNEAVDRRFADRPLRGRREHLETSLTGRFWAYDDPFSATVTASRLVTADELAVSEILDNRRERTLLFSNHNRYDYGHFRVEYHHQYRSSLLDEDRYLPQLKLSWFPNVHNQLTVLAGRGGAYRNPLLNEEHLTYTTRAYEYDTLQTEDFSRYGLSIKGRGFRALDYGIQFVHRNYNRYTAVVYTPDNLLRVEQRRHALRTTLAAEVRKRFTLGTTANYLSLALNYRYDRLTLDDPAGILQPAAHALWTRATVHVYPDKQKKWGMTFKTGFLWQAADRSPSSELMPGRTRSRLDASLRIRHKNYWLALRGEQLLRGQPLYGHGQDLATGLPLGSEFATLGGRFFSLETGVKL